VSKRKSPLWRLSRYVGTEVVAVKRTSWGDGEGWALTLADGRVFVIGDAAFGRNAGGRMNLGPALRAIGRAPGPVKRRTASRVLEALKLAEIDRAESPPGDISTTRGEEGKMMSNDPDGPGDTDDIEEVLKLAANEIRLDELLERRGGAPLCTPEGMRRPPYVWDPEVDGDYGAGIRRTDPPDPAA
jgi:hypothetical protein